jgi:hypothetical protein
MRTRIVITGLVGLGLGAMVEVAGIFYASDILTHNIYGFGGGILVILGIVVLGSGRTRKNPNDER